MKSLIVLALTGLLAGGQAADGDTDGVLHINVDAASGHQRFSSLSRPMVLPPAVTRSAVASHARPGESHGGGAPHLSHPQQEASSAVREDAAAAPFPRHASLAEKHSEVRPPPASHPRPQLITEHQEATFAPLSGKQQIGSSITVGAVQETPRRSALPTHSYPYFHPAAVPGSRDNRAVFPGSHVHSLAASAHHPLDDPSRSSLLIKNLQAMTIERPHVPSSDGALRPAARAPPRTEDMKRRAGPSVHRHHAASQMASSRLKAATSANVHELAGADPPQMAQGFGGDLLRRESLQQNDEKTQPSVVTTLPSVPAERKSSVSAAPQHAVNATATPSHSLAQQQSDSLLRSFFSSPTLLLLGAVFVASAAYMAIAMDQQAAQRRLQQAQLAAAFSGQPASQGRTKRALATQLFPLTGAEGLAVPHHDTPV